MKEECCEAILSDERNKNDLKEEAKEMLSKIKNTERQKGKKAESVSEPRVQFEAKKD
jgi:hypothetical protein